MVPAEVEWTWFCGHCAAPSPSSSPPPPTARVCTSCGLGLLLETRADTAPDPRDAFLVVDTSLLVQAMSRRAQALLELTEAEAVNRPAAELLVAADVRPWNTFGVRMRAKIAPCGPPRAALVVLEDQQSRRLRAVD